MRATWPFLLHQKHVPLVRDSNSALFYQRHGHGECGQIRKLALQPAVPLPSNAFLSIDQTKTYGGQHDYRNRMQCVTLDHDYIVFALDITGELVKRCEVRTLKTSMNRLRFDIKVDFQGCIINPMNA
jgi:hypothetical protein